MLCSCQTGIVHDWVYCDTWVGNMYKKYDFCIFLNLKKEDLRVYMILTDCVLKQKNNAHVW